MMIAKKENQGECQVVDVEACLRQQEKKCDNNNGFPPVEIQCAEKQETLEPAEGEMKPIESSATTIEQEDGKITTLDQRQQPDSALFLILNPSSSGCEKNDEATSSEVQSSSIFSLSDILSGNAANDDSSTTDGASSSFFPTYMIPSSPVVGMTDQLLWRRDGPEEGSVMSTAYFEMTDFDPSNWRNTLTEHEVMVGLAVVYITISLTHPLLFLAGALTAFSTATAVGAGYDFFNQGPIARCFGGNSQTPTSSSEVTLPVVSEDVKPTMPLESTEAILQGALEQEAGPESSKLVYNSDASLDDTTVSVNNKQSPSSKFRDGSNAQPQPSDFSKAMSSMIDQHLPESWIVSHYPPLENTIVEEHEFFGLNIQELFKVFLSDNAPYHYSEFQKKRGDKNIEYGKWHSHTDNSVPLSMHPDAHTPFPQELEIDDYLTRTITFHAKTNNSFLGPPYATTTKEQRLLMVNKRFGIYEMKTTLADIPFWDRFYVMERWILRADKDDSGNYKCQISTSCQVFFVKSCPFESQIRSKTKSSVEDVSKAWLHMATQALKLSEQHKQERIRQEQLADDSDLSSNEDGEPNEVQEEKKEDHKEALVAKLALPDTNAPNDDSENVEITSSEYLKCVDNNNIPIQEDNPKNAPRRTTSFSRLTHMFSTSGRRRKQTS